MKAQAIENILEEIKKLGSEAYATIHMKSGEDYLFNIGDNDELVTEHCEIDGVLQLFCDGMGTVWMDIDNIETIRI